MASRRQKGEAVSSLKDALTRQFGEKARSIVETQVDRQLAGRKGQIGREDLDTIEKGVLASMREQRGGTRRTNKLTRSAPTLPLAMGASTPATVKAPASGAFPPPTPIQATPSRTPPGTSHPGTLMRASSTGEMSAIAKKKLSLTKPAPYGTAITGESSFAVDDTAPAVRCQPRYPVPLPPKLKPMDHWDLIVAFDSQKYKEEEEMLHKTGTHAKKAKFKAVLDSQMEEINANRDNENKGLQEEREMMLAQVEQNKAYHEEEMATIHGKTKIQNDMNNSMMDIIHKRRAKEADRKQKECEDVTRWLANEKQQKEEHDRNQKIEYARRCEAAKKNLEEDRKAREERKRLDDENEIRLMKLRDQMADEAEAAKQKALQDRKDFIEKISKSMGADVAARDAKDAADLEAKIKRIQEEANRAAAEDAKRRQDNHNAKVKDMIAVRQRQIEERGKDDELERQADKKMLERFKQQLDDMKREEAEKQEKRRKAREDLDQSHIEAQRRNAGIHPHHVMMTPRNKKTELGYNKVIFKQMTKEGFMTDALDTLHRDPGKDMHPEGKLLPFPTVPRYTENIHPIELEQPDV